MKKSTKGAVAAAAAGALLFGGGVALAFWTTTGSGSGSGTTGTNTAFTVTSTTAGATLAPGGPAQTVTITVTNPATGPQRLSTLTAAVGTLPNGCVTGDFTVGTVAFSPGDIAASGTTTGTATLTMNNTTLNQDLCKSKTIPLTIAAG